MNIKIYFYYLFILSSFQLSAQFISNDTPKKPDKDKTYVFYLHGGVVQDQGVNAVSTYYGKYDYLGILDTLKQKGFLRDK